MNGDKRRGESLATGYDVVALKAFTHPLRVRLYYALRSAHVASVSHLAQAVGASVAQASYHLQQLHVHGFIKEAPQYARDRRERWWQLGDQRLGWEPSSLIDRPEATAIANLVKATALEEQFRMIDSFQSDESSWDTGWRDAAFMVDGTADLTDTELAQLHGELMEVVKRYAALRAKRPAYEKPQPGVERVMYVLHGFPIRELG